MAFFSKLCSFLGGVFLVEVTVILQIIYHDTCPSLFAGFGFLITILFFFECREESIAEEPIKLWPDVIVSWLFNFGVLRLNPLAESIIPYCICCGLVMYILRSFTVIIAHKNVHNPPLRPEEILAKPLTHHDSSKYRQLMIARQIAARMYHEVEQKAFEALHNYRIYNFDDRIFSDEEAESARAIRNAITAVINEKIQIDINPRIYDVIRFYNFFLKTDLRHPSSEFRERPVHRVRFSGID